MIRQLFDWKRFRNGGISWEKRNREPVFVVGRHITTVLIVMSIEINHLGILSLIQTIVEKYLMLVRDILQANAMLNKQGKNWTSVI
ncbi:MAG: hypothetical protein ACLS8T_32185 [Anaerobutyricum sp.]|jgi:hypothetical protein